MSTSREEIDRLLNPPKVRVGANVPDIDSIIEKHAAEQDVDPDLIRRVIHQESGGRGSAVSPKGARGYMQLMPGTAASLGVRNISDPDENIGGGVRYLRQQLDRFGDVKLALAAYNAGPEAVARRGNRIPPYRETKNYVQNISGGYQGTGYHPRQRSQIDELLASPVGEKSTFQEPVSAPTYNVQQPQDLPPEVAKPAPDIPESIPAVALPTAPTYRPPPKPARAADEFTSAETGDMPIKPFDKEWAGALGQIGNAGPEAQQAYIDFVRRNTKEGKVDAALSDEANAQTFVKIQTFLAQNPDASPEDLTKGIADIGLEFLNDPATKGKQLPKSLHDAMLRAPYAPDEVEKLPRKIQQQRQQLVVGEQRRTAETALQKQTATLAKNAPDKLAAHIAWHFGPQTLAAIGSLPASKQRQIATMAVRAAADDEVRKARGEQIVESADYQATMRKRAGLPERAEGMVMGDFRRIEEQENKQPSVGMGDVRRYEDRQARIAREIRPQVIKDFFGMGAGGVRQDIPIEIAEKQIADDPRLREYIEQETNRRAGQFEAREQRVTQVEQGTAPLLGIADKVRELRDNPEQLIPFLSSIPEFDNLLKIGESTNKLERGEDLTEEERLRLREFVAAGKQDKSVLYQIANVLSALPSFVGEFAATGGIYTAGRKAALKGLEKIVTKKGLATIEKRLVGRLAVKGATSVVGAAAQTLPAGATRIPVGVLYREQEGQEFATALRDTVADQFIEVASERTGGVLSHIPLPKRLSAIRDAVTARWLSKDPGRTAAQLKQIVDKTGWHGPLGEVFEERVGDVARFGAGLQESPIPSLEQLAVEGLSFSVPGATLAIADRLTRTPAEEGERDAGTESIQFQRGQASEPYPESADVAGSVERRSGAPGIRESPKLAEEAQAEALPGGEAVAREEIDRLLAEPEVETPIKEELIAQKVAAIPIGIRRGIKDYLDETGQSIEDATSSVDTRQHRDFTAETSGEIVARLKEKGIKTTERDVEDALYSLRHEALPDEFEPFAAAADEFTKGFEERLSKPVVPGKGETGSLEPTPAERAKIVKEVEAEGAPTRDVLGRTPAPQVEKPHTRQGHADAFLRAEKTIGPDDSRWEQGQKISGIPDTRSRAVWQKNLKEILPEDVESVYHETSLDNARKLIPRLERWNARSHSIDVSDNLDLALGQGGRGVVLEFDPRLVNGFERTGEKPMLGIVKEMGGGTEYRVDSSYVGSVKAIIAKTQRQVDALKKIQGLDKRFDFNAATQTERGIRVPRFAAKAETKAVDEAPAVVVKSYKPRSRAVDTQTMSLSQAVRAAGGIKADRDLANQSEVSRLSNKEAATSGLVNNRSGSKVEDMAMAMAEQGYRGDWVEEIPGEQGLRTKPKYDIDPNKFLEAVENDQRGIAPSHSMERDVDFDAEYRKEYPKEMASYDNLVSLMEHPEAGKIYDKVINGEANEADITAFRKVAKEYGVSEQDVSHIVTEGEQARSSEAASRQSPSESPAQQLGFISEGLEQQTAPPPKQPDQRARLIEEEQARQRAKNPEKAAALDTLARLREKGMTVDDYARQGSLIGETPSPEKLKLLRELEGARPLETSPTGDALNFGPGAASAKEPFPEVKERKFGKRFTEDENIAQDIRDSIGTAKYYEPIPNNVTAKDAQRLVDERGISSSMAAIRDENNGLAFHVRSTMGQLVIKRLNKAYRALKANSLADAELVLDQATDMAEWQMDYGTRLGQGVQSFAIWARLTPEGKLLTFKRAVDKARQRHKAAHGDEVQEIVDAANKEGMTDQQRLDEVERLFKMNKTARKVKTDLRRLIDAAKDGKLTDEKFYEITAKRLGLPEYDKTVAARITEIAGRIEDAPEGIPQDRAIFELNKYIAQQKGFGVEDLPIGIYYGNILSGYNTHIVNTVDTFMNVLSEVNGLTIQNPRSALKIYAGMFRGLADGRLDAMLALTTGRMATDGKWMEIPRLMEIAEFGKKGGVPIQTKGSVGRAVKRVAESKIGYPLNAYKYVTRLLAASDAIMFRSAKEARAALLANRIAEAEGLTGNEASRRVRQILALDREADFTAQAEREGFTGREAKARAAELRDMVRDKDLNSDAADFAGEATYNHEPHGTLGYLSKKVGEASERVKPLKLFVPFTRIVANVTNRGLNYTPYGFKRAFAGYSGHPELLSPEARNLMIVRATLGTAGLVAMGGLQAAGVLTIHGAGPSDRERRRQLQQAGWRPYSVQIGDEFFSYVYTPLSLGLSVVGNMSDSQRYHELEEKDAATRGAYAIARVGSTVFSQSFLSGLSRLFSALSEHPQQSVTAVKQTLSSTASAMTAPNLAKDVFKLFDNKAYQSNTLMEDLVRNTPFAALVLKPQLNAFGEPVRVQRQRFVDVMTSDPVWRFVIDKGLRVPVPSRTSEVTEYDNKAETKAERRITPEEYYELILKTGPQLKAWIAEHKDRLSEMSEEKAQDELSEAASGITRKEMKALRKKIKESAP